MKTLKLSILTFTVLITALISCKKKDASSQAPTISSFSPTSAYSGDTVIITGTHFTGATAVSFGNSPAASFTVSNSTSIKAVVGDGATGDIKVATLEGTATLGGFTLKVSAPAITVTDSIEIPFSTNNYTFYSFKDSSVVANSDSATTKWDFGIRLVNIIVNSHASGPGNAGVITESGLFDNFAAAPSSGYAYDTTTTSLGIDAGVTNGWYDYDINTHAFSPKAGRFFVIRTADNHYAKLEILAVNYAGFVSPTAPPTTLIYKFRYTYQADGSRNF
jgi:hypothetical protein